MGLSPKQLAQQVTDEIVNGAVDATRQNINTGTRYGSQTTTNISVGGDHIAGDYHAGDYAENVYGDQTSR
ncbi:predicted protein [Streptomyces viridosporus ATCC 14672]|uniref:Predicted protein n=1 Tax=Streptomyces viridosporus (strain ATCC 14672 / DSM 40746 / JCM 4963 / KCTC 9882 / NRRL B-12104 / FH 1290) TaxID=566461 RepID=D6A4F1_STRV1|nr:hypothetical protein [Streptomyces viridosporus]EFE65791.1 predicted protein [Streptomyces viridosporus ATCC 14672]